MNLCFFKQLHGKPHIFRIHYICALCNVLVAIRNAGGAGFGYLRFTFLDCSLNSNHENARTTGPISVDYTTMHTAATTPGATALLPPEFLWLTVLN
ncbi:hypothetical protein AOV_05205 [Anaplasma ovis str. Haibei]|uniref:Uncharacterized protein n=1 Tax=Anaplasma ovis str. Haibei TaxID=1248439 RepID=A0A2Z2L923_9RICK|nr:hypothetical protein AOV_05205 [Anaplasma ovis str. Haibei]